MIRAEDSPYLECSLDRLAAAARSEVLRRTPSLEDPVLTALGWQARQSMHGACALLASHLHETRGWPAVILESRAPGRSWSMRHAAVTPVPVEEARAILSAGGETGLPIIDAAGGGGMAERLDLYRDADREYRVVLAEDPRCSVHWLWVPNALRPPSAQEDEIALLPALAHRLGTRFELRPALASILGEPWSRGRPGADAVWGSGLVEWVSPPSPAP